MPSVIPSLLFVAAALSAATAAFPHDAHDHDHSVNKALPGRWYQDEDHAVHALFKRAGPTDGVNYPAIGTPEWAAGFPPEKADTTTMPKAWLDKLNAVKAAGKIPANVPVSTQSGGGNPTYGDLDPNGQVVCSTTYKCRAPGTVWDAPDGLFASSFDDGPLPTSMPLYEFLKQNNVITTHFMIGTNILQNADAFKYAHDTLDSDIAVHTWTHPYMTTLPDEGVVAELGWTLELIHNSTGGRIAKYWRPPYGDADNRVVAIAKEVFGLITVIWNQDTEDWSIGEAKGRTRDQVDADLQKWITGPKSPGLVILEHELTNDTVDAFMKAYPLIGQNGWKFVSLARMDGGSVYQNSPSNDGPISPALVAGNASVPPTTTSSSTSSAQPTATAGNNQANNTKTTSSKGAQATGQGAAQNSALAQVASPLFAGLATLMSLVGAAFALS